MRLLSLAQRLRAVVKLLLPGVLIVVVVSQMTRSSIAPGGWVVIAVLTLGWAYRLWSKRRLFFGDETSPWFDSDTAAGARHVDEIMATHDPAAGPSPGRDDPHSTPLPPEPGGRRAD